MRTFCFILSFVSFSVLASTDVMEGDEVQSNYEASKDSTIALIQKRKTFYLQEPGNPKLKRKPKEITVKAGEVIYIINNEKKITHNIYDTSDESWVLTAQEPGDIAALKFTTKGVHDLKCAIHPKMKVKLIVE